MIGMLGKFWMPFDLLLCEQPARYNIVSGADNLGLSLDKRLFRVICMWDQ